MSDLRLHGLYSYGYLGAALDDLRGYAAAGALILDVRYAPTSRNPVWRRAHLRRELGRRYDWCRDLGNESYRSGEAIRIADLDAGLRRLESCLSEGPVVLLCACADWRACHRRTVAEAAAAVFPGLRIVHLAPGEPLAEAQQ